MYSNDAVIATYSLLCILLLDIKQAHRKARARNEYQVSGPRNPRVVGTIKGLGLATQVHFDTTILILVPRLSCFNSVKLSPVHAYVVRRFAVLL